jgi:hypothetical protein
MTAPARIAMCSNPRGTHEHVPLDPDEPMPTTCFADCDCTPVEFVRADQLTGAVEDRAKLFAWIHEISGHFVDPAGACRSCAILASYLELSGGASAQSDAQPQTGSQA